MNKLRVHTCYTHRQVHVRCMAPTFHGGNLDYLDAVREAGYCIDAPEVTAGSHRRFESSAGPAIFAYYHIHSR